MRDARSELVARWMGDLGDLGIVADWGSVMLGGKMITACPWWDGPATRDEIGRQLERDAAVDKRRWIWVYHAPPSDSPVSRGGQRHYGDGDLGRPDRADVGVQIRPADRRDAVPYRP